ncbi:MAG: EF-hand domain-containing protein [Burkholderiaceae bacterium]|jgi:hypothetical protein|nr:EF-hand domain-containing protein [Burkholderiaceae bacterium]
MRSMTFPIRSLILCAMLPLAAAAQTPNSAPPASDPGVVPTAPVAETPEQARARQEADEAQYRLWFNLLDTNHDGCISRQEAQSGIQTVPLLGLYAKKLLRDFDDADAIRHSGCITPEDIRTLAARRRAERLVRRAAEAQQKAAAQNSAHNTAQTPAPDAPLSAAASASQP